MSRARLLSIALLAAATLTACGAPTAPAAGVTIQAPSLDEGTVGDTTTAPARGGFQDGHG